MDIKKDPKYDLDRVKSLFFQGGLVFALAAVLFAFEWKRTDGGGDDMNLLQVTDIPEEMVEITRQEEPEPPKPEKTTTELEIVEDDVEVDDDLDINAEDDMDTEVGDFIAQDDVEVEIVEAEIFTIVEEQPGFPGGEEALFEYLQKNISYPQMAKESNIQGTVFVTFVVEPDGSISNTKVLRGIGGGCDVEAIRVVKKMPRWTPGKQRGKPVRVQFNLPIKFVLQG